MTAFSVNPEMLIAFRAVMGVGAALILPATLAIINNVFPRKSAERPSGYGQGCWGSPSHWGR